MSKTILESLEKVTNRRAFFAKLASAASALAEAGETVRVSLHPAVDGSGMIELTVTRPARLAGLGETELFDPGYGPEGDWPDAPLLGLGFSLHLVRRLAGAAGGSLRIEDHDFALRLPMADDAVRAGSGR